MTKRKKMGIGEAVTGLVFLISAFISLRYDVDPQWLPLAFQIVGTVSAILGFVTVFPDRE